jgi:hypothetical protein
MSIFNTILEKLGIEKPAPNAAGTKVTSNVPYTPVSSPTASASGAPATMGSSGGDVSLGSSTSAISQPKNIPIVDVVTKLDGLQASFHNPQLTWRVSISDLLYILKIDNSSKGLKDLAVELGCPENLMSDSAKRNMWLHSTVLKKIAESGGNIPQELIKHVV